MSKLESSPEHPLPLRRVSAAIAGWVHRLGEVWVEGQVAQLKRRPGVPTTFLTVRDTDANISMTVTAASTLVDSAQIAEGARIVMRARPDFYAERGTLSLRASAIRQVGTGELLVRIEQLKRLLAAEGLFAADRKRPLPFWPLRIGLISGRSSAAAHDVVENARRRFPAARFEVESVATQGPAAVSEIVAALGRLDAAPAVSVIVIARGGGSVEDLLPFSNETLLRAVAAARTPVVSAIGHETDAPLLDLVADLACSTPTDAGKRIVPDRDEEERLIARMRGRARQVVNLRLDREREAMAELPGRLTAVLTRRLDTDRADVQAVRDRARRRMAELLEANRAELTQMRARVIALSPKATLRRGYAVVIAPDGTAVRAPDQARGLLTVYVERGSFGARAVPDGG
ncbi:MAG TPA: exodeoxyribonuclease VII large subunit [Jatrophihabitantaceae bacterium]|jgi:exodeoxyribonuclease VII large subunit|nr:exodeoxyribonuclease VII large subunit [Jatrophihabitantaceae bacterium]